MAFGELGPQLRALAELQGAEAAKVRNTRGYAPSCPYDRQSESITERRLAAVWWEALLDNSTTARINPGHQPG